MSIKVVVALIINGPRILIARRKKGAHLAGFWEFPGGKPEVGESDEAALCREVKEETGLEIRIGELFNEITWPYPEKTVHLKFYLAYPKNDPNLVKPLESTTVEWLHYSELSSREFPPANLEVLGKLMNEMAARTPFTP